MNFEIINRSSIQMVSHIHTHVDHKDFHWQQREQSKYRSLCDIEELIDFAQTHLHAGGDPLAAEALQSIHLDLADLHLALRTREVVVPFLHGTDVF